MNNDTITFGSVCSGIEAASVAWHPLGWRAAWLAEIEAAPSQVLAHHYPDVPNLGDMNLIPGLLRNGDIRAPDVFCGGTPCQAFSVAGLRNSLDDARGNLSLKFCDIANEIDIQRAATGLLPCTVFWENVPGVLSTKDNAFGCFLGQLAGEDCELVPPGGKWKDAGAVFGPQRAIAWRVLDAQYFGVAQRRRRVFVVASARNGFDPAAILFEFEGVRRDSAPRRSTGQETAGTLAARTDGGGFPGTDEACSGYVQPVTGTLTATYGEQSGQDLMDMQGGIQVAPLAFGGNNTAGSSDIDTACRAHASPHYDFESETFLVQPAIAVSCKDYGNDATVELAPTMRAMGHSGSHANAGGQLAVCVTGDITNTLKAEGFDASEDGTGRSQPIVAVQLNGDCYGQLVNGARESAEGMPAGAVRDMRETGCGSASQERGLVRPLSGESAAPVPQLPHQSSPGARDVHAVQQATQGVGVLRHALPEVQDMGRSDHREGQPVHQGAEGFGAQPGQAMQGGGVRIENARQGVLREACVAEQSRHVGDQQHQQSRSNAKGMGHPAYAVRRLLPIECEKLQGFPPGYTAIPLPERRQSAGAAVRVMADGPRYKALGNSWAVPVVRWIGARLDAALRNT